MEFAERSPKGTRRRDLVLAVETVLAGGTFFPGQKTGSTYVGVDLEALQEWQTLAGYGELPASAVRSFALG